jgi:predicted dehydrogenase
VSAPLRVAIIGLGVISRFYAAALEDGTGVPGARLSAVCDLDPARLEPYRGRVACLDSAASLLARDDVDAVVVAVPNDLHLPVCRDALLAGKAVCVEKPLATRLEDGEALVALSERLGVPLFTAFHRRYNHNVAALARRLAHHRPPRHLTVRYLERIEEHAGPDGWYLEPSRCGGGCVADNGPNAFDLARLLFGGEVELAAAEVVRDGRGVDVRASIELLAGSGASALVELDWAYPGERKDVDVRVAGGRTLRADMLAGFDGFKRSLWHEYRAMLGDFDAACRRRRPDPDGGLAALRLVDAVYRGEEEEGHAETTR